jgi:hypothetical protein
MSGYDPDGIAQTEADYFEKCPVCADWFDVRDVAQMALHIHDLTDVEIIIGRAAAPRRAGAVSDDLKSLRSTQVAARIVFALGITALVAILVYYGILWLIGRP